MKIFLDDIRKSPDDSWVVFRTAEALIAFLDWNPHLVVTTMSLDHDLGEDMISGHEFISWYEEKIYRREHKRPTDGISIHSANPVGSAQMMQAIHNIYWRFKE